MCCTRLAENTGRKKSPKTRHLHTVIQLISTVSSSISSRCPHNMVNFGALAAEIGPGFWCTPANFNGLRILAVLLHGTPAVGQQWAWAKLCGVEQRAPPIFGRAAVTLGISPHSSFPESCAWQPKCIFSDHVFLLRLVTVKAEKVVTTMSKLSLVVGWYSYYHLS